MEAWEVWVGGPMGLSCLCLSLYWRYTLWPEELAQASWHAGPLVPVLLSNFVFFQVHGSYRRVALGLRSITGFVFSLLSDLSWSFELSSIHIGETLPFAHSEPLPTTTSIGWHRVFRSNNLSTGPSTSTHSRRLDQPELRWPRSVYPHILCSPWINDDEKRT